MRGLAEEAPQGTAPSSKFQKGSMHFPLMAGSTLARVWGPILNTLSTSLPTQEQAPAVDQTVPPPSGEGEWSALVSLLDLILPFQVKLGKHLPLPTGLSDMLITLRAPTCSL